MISANLVLPAKDWKWAGALWTFYPVHTAPVTPSTESQLFTFFASFYDLDESKGKDRSTQPTLDLIDRWAYHFPCIEVSSQAQKHEISPTLSVSIDPPHPLALIKIRLTSNKHALSAALISGNAPAHCNLQARIFPRSMEPRMSLNWVCVQLLVFCSIFRNSTAISLRGSSHGHATRLVRVSMPKNGRDLPNLTLDLLSGIQQTQIEK